MKLLSFFPEFPQFSRVFSRAAFSSILCVGVLSLSGCKFEWGEEDEEDDLASLITNGVDMNDGVFTPTNPGATPTPSPAPSPTPGFTPVPTPTPEPSPTPTPEPTPSPTPEPTPSPTPEPTPTPTPEPTP